MGMFEPAEKVLGPVEYPMAPEPEVEGSALAAGFRTENLAVNAYQAGRKSVFGLAYTDENVFQEVFGDSPNPDFNAWELIKGTRYQDRWNEFVEARSPMQVASIKREIDQEMKDRQILDAAGGAGVAAQLAAGFLDVPSLIPGSQAIRGASRGASMGRNALRTSRAAMTEAAAVEGLLQEMQRTRTVGESAVAIGGSMFLGLVLGGAAGAVIRKTPEGQAALKAAGDYYDGKPYETGFGLDTEVRKTEGIGADIVSVKPEPGDFKLPTVAAQKVVDFTPPGLTFGMTFLKAKSPVAQKLGAELIDTPFAVRGTDRLGLEPAVEVAHAVELDRARVNISRAFQENYADYRKETGIGRIGSAFERVGAENLTRSEFGNRVARAMRRGDVDENSFVAATAARLRKDIVEPLKVKAISSGLLPEDVKVTTAASYFTRMWNTEEIVRRASEFKTRLSAHIRGGFSERKLRGEAGFDLDDVELDGYASEAAANIYETLTGNDRFPDSFGITVKSRGPMKERTLNVQDLDFEDFLLDDAEYVLNRYARIMTADIELTNRFGSADLEQQIRDVSADYEKLIEKAPEGKARSDLHAEKDRVVERVKASRDLMRGTYEIGSRSGVPYRIIQSAMTYNFVRALGDLVKSALPDVYRLAMQNGLGNTMEGAVKPLMRNLKQYRMQTKRATELAGIAEVELNNRLMRIADITDPMGHRTPVEAAINNMGSLASLLSGGGHWNQMLKGMATQVSTNRFRHLGKRKTDKVFLNRLQVNQRDADAIKAAMKKHGVEVEGVFDPRVDFWQERTREIYSRAIRADAETVIVTPGIADKIPAAEHHYWLKPALQFKSFAVAAHSRVLVAGLQEDQARFLKSSLIMSSMGMFVYWLKAQSSGKETSDNPGTWIAEGIDRAGLFPVIMEVNNWNESLGLPGVYGILSMGEDEASRYAVRSIAGRVMGPTAGLISDLAVVSRFMFSQANPIASDKAKKLTAGDIGSARRLVPFGRHPGIREYIDLHLVPSMKEALN